MSQYRSPNRSGSSFRRAYDTKSPGNDQAARRYTSPSQRLNSSPSPLRRNTSPTPAAQRRFSTFKGYQVKDSGDGVRREASGSPVRYMTVNQALKKTAEDETPMHHDRDGYYEGAYGNRPDLPAHMRHSNTVKLLSDGRVSVKGQIQTEYQQVAQNDTRYYDYQGASPKRRETVSNASPARNGSTKALRHSQSAAVVDNSYNRNDSPGGRESGKSFRQRYAEQFGDGVQTTTPYHDTVSQEARPLAKMMHLNNSTGSFDVNQRYKKDYSTFASNQNDCHRRVFFFGDLEVGKTSLWLRYMFYDQKRADVGVKQTPNRDGYIFTKQLADGNSNYTMELWDFLTPLEARQCLNLKIQDPKHARYDAKNINREYIGNSDVAVLVYDVMKPHTFDWCRTEANQLASWGVKKIIFAGNKSDGDTAIDLDDAANWFSENNVKNFFVCATNNVGVQELCIEVDRVDDIGGGSLYTLDCLQGMPSEHVRTIFAEEQEIACLQLAWLAFRSEMKYYENKHEKDSYWIRSDMNDTLCREIEREHQIEEIQQKMPEMKGMLEYQIKVAEDLGVTHTAEFEEAYRKYTEMTIIESKLDARLKRLQLIHKRYNWCIILSLILLILFLIYTIHYYYRKPDISFEIAQKAAEKKLLEYNKDALLSAKNTDQKHIDAVKLFRADLEVQNQKLNTVINSNNDDIDIQIKYGMAMLQNKKTVLDQGMFLPANIHVKMTEIKMMNIRSEAYQFMESDPVPQEVFSKWKYQYDAMLNGVAVEAALHLEASNVMETGYTNYLHQYKQNDNENSAAELSNITKDFNDNLVDVHAKALIELHTAQVLNEQFMEIQKHFIAAASHLMDIIAGLPNRHLSVKQSQAKCVTACKAYKTDICLNLGFADANQFIEQQTPNAELSLIEKVRRSLAGKPIVSEMIRKSLSRFDTQLVDPTSAELSTESDLIDYRSFSKSVKALATNYQNGINSDIVKFNKIAPREPTDDEKIIFAEYTDATCKEAHDAYLRHEKVKLYAFLFLLFTIILILVFLCCGCLTCCKLCRKRRKNNYFGHNNGEDRLIVNHHWQEESEQPEPLYICVRDPNLKEVSVQQAY